MSFEDDLERLRGEDPDLAEKLELLRSWVEAAKQERENEELLRLDTEASQPAPAFLYQPGTAHPAYTEQAATIRRYMGEGRRRIVLPKPLPRSALFTPVAELSAWPAPSFEVEELDVKRAAGPAPYVGRPFVYVWDVAIDKQQRWVAAESVRVVYL